MAAEKILEWSGSSKRDLMDFPEDVRRAFGYALGVAQLGAKHPSAKPWKGEGAGVLEVVESDEGNAYRAVYTVRFSNVVYVLHCFQKKSPSGIRTAKKDIELVHKRLKAAQQHYEENYEKASKNPR
ncbi:type II toxin-antitoxin system RelE/ParE family toxin [Rhodoferax sp.]|uniref:type II toxin-antitoxin system RelE/ParE family toxin n=1 Tax=Rhodoferax sp. TaxID=50421 RepID=UPI0019DE2B70|nr:type II toxin-antitoxin system RelE/ParE family toxin [Rhodoferax sp.]MBE0474912.1 type II toxin-antitoxin system RelE/ParE family toxin [Rhodoferax sp.]